MGSSKSNRRDTTINPMPIKKRAESHHNRNDKEAGGLVDLDHLDRPKSNGEDEQVEYIQSTNIKTAKRNGQREIRAPSTGSSGSQPRVVATGEKTLHSQNSVNSSGIQRRYDSIEHQRQSQIDKFLASPQDQIAVMMNQRAKIHTANLSIHDRA